MSPMTAWKEKFQVSPSCTLAKALKNQLINEIEYQEWASRYYGLPIMQDEFFKQHPSDIKFLDKIKKQNIANPSAIPCFEWNNILYVACLEPQKINTDQTTVLFITSLQTMESLWKNIKPAVQQASSSEKPLSLLEKTDSPLKKEKALSTNKESTVQKIDQEKPLDIKEKSNVKKMENDDGIEFERMNPLRAFLLTMGDLSKNFMDFIAPDQKNSKKTKKQKTKSITISNADKNKIKEVKEASSQTIIPKSITPEIEEGHQSKTTSPATPDSTEEKKSAMPIALDTEEKSDSSDKAVKEPENKEETLMPIALDTEEKSDSSDKAVKESENKEETLMPIALDTEEKSDSLDQKKVTSMDQLSPLRKALEETKHYVNSYILFVFKKDSFIPYKWSSNLQEVDKRVPGTIQKPSIFRIVHVSKQPYFGHLAPVLANNSFFNHWGFETLPKHVILIPFLDTEKQNVLGVYLGISETRTLPIKCLHAVEQMVQTLSTHYENGSLLQKVS